MQEGLKRKIYKRAETFERKAAELERLLKLHLPDSSSSFAATGARGQATMIRIQLEKELGQPG